VHYEPGANTAIFSKLSKKGHLPQKGANTLFGAHIALQREINIPFMVYEQLRKNFN
tara:strand:- start:1209 stop:1376 length:168 start_codon:yes stop_codon:yes gene_type:complete